MGEVQPLTCYLSSHTCGSINATTCSDLNDSSPVIIKIRLTIIVCLVLFYFTVMNDNYGFPDRLASSHHSVIYNCCAQLFV